MIEEEISDTLVSLILSDENIRVVVQLVVAQIKGESLSSVFKHVPLKSQFDILKIIINCSLEAFVFRDIARSIVVDIPDNQLGNIFQTHPSLKQELKFIEQFYKSAFDDLCCSPRLKQLFAFKEEITQIGSLIEEIDRIRFSVFKSIIGIRGDLASYLNSESNRTRLEAILRYKQAVLVTGDEMSGKSSLIYETFASQNYFTFYVDSGSEYSSLIGNYIIGSESEREFEWRNGLLVKAMIQGSVLVMEAFELANPQLISSIQGFISTLSVRVQDKMITPSPGFKIIFLSRTPNILKGVTELVIESIDFENIVNKRCSKINLDQRISNLVSEIVKAVSANFPKCSKSQMSRLIDRLIDILKIVNTNSNSLFLSSEIKTNILLAIRDLFFNGDTGEILEWEELGNVTMVFGVEVQEAIILLNHFEPRLQLSKNEVTTSRSIFSRNNTSDSEIDKFFCSTSSVISLLDKISVSVKLNESVLLIGETGCGKTSVIQHFANISGNRLKVINLSKVTDVSDIFGGFKPVSVKQRCLSILNKIKLFLENFYDVSKNTEFIMYLLKSIENGNYVAFAKTAISGCKKLLATAPSRSLNESEKSRYRNHSCELQNAESELQNIVQSKHVPKFEFVKGVLSECYEQGYWLLVDEINLAPESVLLRLSTIITSSRLQLDEGGFSINIERSRGFRLFACMNPAFEVGKKALPTRTSNLMSSFKVSAMENVDEIANLISHLFRRLPSVNKSITFSLAEFFHKIRYLSQVNEIRDTNDRKLPISIRQLRRGIELSKSLMESEHITIGVINALYAGCRVAFRLEMSTESQSKFDCLFDEIMHSKEIAKRYVREDFFMLTPKSFRILLSHPIPNFGTFIEIPPHILTPTLSELLPDILKVLSFNSELPILLEGPTSCGKTSLLTFLAAHYGKKLVRINNHRDTDVEEYIGGWVPDVQGGARFKEGVLLTAMRNGQWLLLDELNLAKSEILEALNRILDDNREIYVPELNETVRPATGFRIFATQNPSSYSGRSLLSAAFRNRFISVSLDHLTNEDLIRVMQERGQLPESRLKSILSTMNRLHSLRSVDSALGGKESLITVRDLLRWSSRPMSAESKEGLAMEGFWLLGERVRETDNKKMIENIISKECIGKETSLDKSYELIYQDILQKYPIVLDLIAQLNLRVNNSFKRALALGFRALSNQQSVLLIGEAGTGKTSIANLISKILNVVYYSINCHKQTEAADFLGSWRPKRDIHGFEWVEGELIKAIRTGGLYLIDEISLASDSVLERLNSLLEFDRKISFQGGNDELVELKAVDNFYLVATMNPGGDQGKRELSPALRNRFCEIWVTSPFDDEADVIELIHLVMPQSIKDSPIYSTLVDFFRKLIKIINYENIHLFKPWTIRDLKSWSEMIGKLMQNNMSLLKSLFVSLEHLFDSTIGIIESDETRLLATDILFEVKNLFYVSNGLINLVSQEICLEITDSHLMVEGIELRTENKLNATTSRFNRNAYITEDTGVKENIFRIVLGMLSGRSVMLEGPPGIGKTSLVEWMACCLNKQVYRISLSEQTDMIDLLGNDCPDPNYPSKFIWRDGSLLRALKSGDWILLDELNLASQTVLEGLNSLLDHRGLIYLPELNQTIVKSPEFRLFSTQNPHSMGSGRKGLPLSFMNRFTRVYLKDIEISSLRNVTNKLSKGEDRIFIENFIELCKVNNVPKTDFNLRLIKRFILFFEKYKTFPLQMKILGAMYLFVKNISNLHIIYDILESNNMIPKNAIVTYVEKLQTLALYNEESLDEPSIIHPLSLKVTCSDLSVLSRETCFIAWRVLMGVDMSLPIIIMHSSENHFIVTSILEQLAVSNLKNLVKVRLFSSADLSELLGSFEQMDWKSSLNKLVKSLNLKFEASMNEEMILNQIKIMNDPLINQKITEIDEIRQKGGSMFVWRDSELINASIAGDWIVLDNCQEVNPAIIEKLNGFLEDRRLIIEESFESDGNPREIHANPSFRIFLLYQTDKGKKPSNALTNRCLTLSVDRNYSESISPIENIRKVGARKNILNCIGTSGEYVEYMTEVNDLEFSSFMKNVLSNPISNLKSIDDVPCMHDNGMVSETSTSTELIFDMKINNVIRNILIRDSDTFINIINSLEFSGSTLLNICLERLNSLNPKMVQFYVDKCPLSQSRLLVLSALNDSDILNCQDRYSLFKNEQSNPQNMLDIENISSIELLREPAVIVSIIFLQRLLFPNFDIKNRLFYDHKEGVCLKSLLFDQTFWTKMKLSEIFFPNSVLGLRQLLLEICISLKDQFIDLSVNLLEDSKENPSFEKLVIIGSQINQTVDSNFLEILRQIKSSKIKLIDQAEDEDLFLDIPSKQINMAIDCLISLSPELVPNELDLTTSEWTVSYQSISNFSQRLNTIVNILDSHKDISGTFDQILKIKSIVASKYRKLGLEIMKQSTLKINTIREIPLYESIRMRLKRISEFLEKVESSCFKNTLGDKVVQFMNMSNLSNVAQSTHPIIKNDRRSMSMDEFIMEVQSIAEVELELFKSEKSEIKNLMPRLSKTMELKQLRKELILKIENLNKRVSSLHRKRIVIADINSNAKQDFLFSHILQNGKFVVQSSSVDSYDHENKLIDKMNLIKQMTISDFEDGRVDETIEEVLDLYFKIGGSMNSNSLNDSEIEILSEILIVNSKFKQTKTPNSSKNGSNLLSEIDSSQSLKNIRHEINTDIKKEISDLSVLYLKELDELTTGNTLNTEAANEHRLLKALKKATVDEYTKQAVEMHKEDELKEYQKFFEPQDESVTIVEKKQKCLYVFNQSIFWLLSSLETRCSLNFGKSSSDLDRLKDISLLPLSSLINYFLDEKNQNAQPSNLVQCVNVCQSKIGPLNDLLNLLIQLELESNTKKCFYQDEIDYNSLKKIVDVVDRVSCVLGNIVSIEEEVRNLPSFIKVVRSVNLLLEGQRNSSSSLVATFLERLIESLGELNNFLPSNLKILNELNEITNFLRELRRSERSLFQSFASKQKLLFAAQSIYSLSHLLNEHNENRNSEKFLSDVDTIIRSTSIGAFPVVATILLCYSSNYSKLSSNLICLYSSFCEELTSMIKEATSRGTEILKSASKLMNWHFDDIMNLKLNVAKYRKAILRAARHQQEGLETPFYCSVVQVARNSQIFGEFEPFCTFVSGRMIKDKTKLEKPRKLKKEKIINLFENKSLIQECLNRDGLSLWTIISIKKLLLISSSKEVSKRKYEILRKSLPKDSLWRFCKEYLNRMNALKKNSGRTYKLRALTDFMKDLVNWEIKGRAVGTKDLTFDKLLSSVSIIDNEFGNILEFVNFDNLDVEGKIKTINNRIFRIADNFRVLGETKDLTVEIDTMMREKLTGINLSAYHLFVKHNKIVKSILKFTVEITQLIYHDQMIKRNALSKIQSIVFKYKNKWSPSQSKINEIYGKFEELLTTNDLMSIDCYIDNIANDLIIESEITKTMITQIKETISEYKIAISKSENENLLKCDFNKEYQVSKKRMRFDFFKLINESNPFKEQEGILLSIQRYFRDIRKNLKNSNFVSIVNEIVLDLKVKIIHCIDWLFTLSKFTYLVSVVFCNLQVKGFCTPLEDQGEPLTTGDFETEIGTGIGEGRGEDDITKELEFDEQVAGVKGEQECEEPEDDLKADENEMEIDREFKGDNNKKKEEDPEKEEDDNKNEKEEKEAEDEFDNVDKDDLDLKLFQDENKSNEDHNEDEEEQRRNAENLELNAEQLNKQNEIQKAKEDNNNDVRNLNKDGVENSQEENENDDNQSETHNESQIEDPRDEKWDNSYVSEGDDKSNGNDNNEDQEMELEINSEYDAELNNSNDDMMEEEEEMEAQNSEENHVEEKNKNKLDAKDETENQIKSKPENQQNEVNKELSGNENKNLKTEQSIQSKENSGTDQNELNKAEKKKQIIKNILDSKDILDPESINKLMEDIELVDNKNENEEENPEDKENEWTIDKNENKGFSAKGLTNKNQKNIQNENFNPDDKPAEEKESKTPKNKNTNNILNKRNNDKDEEEGEKEVDILKTDERMPELGVIEPNKKIKTEIRIKAENSISQELYDFYTNEVETITQSKEGLFTVDTARMIIQSETDRLCEFLKSILEQRKAIDLRGDFRTGKRLNIRRLVSYIASNYRKDKIWLRRIEPSDRDYRILLAVDDSSSMMEKNVGREALYSLSILAGALTKASVGDLTIASIRNGMKIVEGPTKTWSERTTDKVFKEFNFQYQAECSADLSMPCFIEQSQNFLLKSNDEKRSICIILSDGRLNKELVCEKLIEAESRGIIYIYFLLDITDELNSVINYRTTKIENGPEGVKVIIREYMEDFPFRYYIIIKDMKKLAENIASVLRQCFEQED